MLAAERKATADNARRDEPDPAARQSPQGALDYEVLGPLRVTGPAGTSSVTSRKAETLLGLLLIRAEQLVTTDQLIGELWGDFPPGRAIASVHVYISQLRKLLRQAGTAGDPILTRPTGYLLRIDGDRLDVHAFAHQSRLGRACAKEHRYEQAATSFNSALALWRGPLLGGTPGGPVISGYATWLDETRAECLERLIDAELVLGRHREAVGRLYSLAAEYPTREAFHRQLMLALYRCGRQADALKAFQTVRSTLHDELGLEPGIELQRIQLAILKADPLLHEPMATC
ncbi:AfsR/SARP family transcriptional regulator [Actinocrinis puniceicyclus]|uniref:AfsR/SARP family transcriptional regulator n=1 Tax=Actinocrinis puniceicyclus TaxID=977794 RepID=A0A8J7WQH4_9ACTN|nr:AfsR/SARP family transcriptional regulator [Actinocrinis puniceicyclus]MBS2966781.1 AfsR/SARP family transcriptional regulator [Actinocrinis puniceicyclus]